VHIEVFERSDGGKVDLDMGTLCHFAVRNESVSTKFDVPSPPDLRMIASRVVSRTARDSSERNENSQCNLHRVE